MDYHGSSNGGLNAVLKDSYSVELSYVIEKKVAIRLTRKPER